MSAPKLSISRRTRNTLFTKRVTDQGVTAYTVYNHMLLPTAFKSLEEDYWHLCEHVQVWDVSAERQVDIQGPDCARLVQLMTPRNISKARVGQCFYLPLCDEHGKLMNDPVGLKLDEGHWSLSIADSDILLWAKGLATGYKLNVSVREPDVSPLAVQGPKAEDLMAKVFGEQIRNIGFFKFEHLSFNGYKMVVSRSGWSKQGGFEIYVDNPITGVQLWDKLFDLGKPLNVRAGCPNGIERLESGLLSFGNDMDFNDTPYDCGLDRYVSIKDDIESLSLPALRKYAKTPQRTLVGLVLAQEVGSIDTTLQIDGTIAGEIRSQCWSPRHQCHLAFAMCKRELIQGKSKIEVRHKTGTVIAQIRELPFDLHSSV